MSRGWRCLIEEVWINEFEVEINFFLELLMCECS